MIKIYTIVFFLTSAFLFGCTPDVTTVQVIRHPTITFSYDATSMWQDNSYSFAPVTQTVVYPQDTTRPGQIYHRQTLQAMGKDDKGNSLQLIITFDMADESQFVGTYTTDYTTQRGLAQVQLFNVTDANNLSAYNLCRANLSDAVLNIEKQKPDERLISGSFRMTLCNQRDSTEKITITNGVLTDITY